MKITFSGDIAFSNYFRYDKFNNFVDDKVSEFLQNNDYNIFNIEGALTHHNSIKGEGASHSSDPKSIDLINNMNCNIFNLGNNHIMDCGIEGLKDTLNLASKNNIDTIGAGLNLEMASKPLFLNDGNTTVSVISISHPEGILASEDSAGVFSDNNRQLIKKRLSDMKKRSDWVVVVYHGGEEYSLAPNPNRRKRFLKYLDYGADIIVSHHAHVTQGYECIKGKYIFYSLGNFIFDTDNQRRMFKTDVGLLVKLTFQKEKIQIETLFTKIDRNSNRVILNDKTILQEINVNLLKDNWEKEAYRIVFGGNQKRNISTHENERNVKVLQRSKGKILKKLVNKLFNIIKYQNVRDIYLGAIKYYIKKKVLRKAS